MKHLSVGCSLDPGTVPLTTSASILGLWLNVEQKAFKTVSPPPGRFFSHTGQGV